MNLSRWSRCAEWAVLAGVVGLHVALTILARMNSGSSLVPGALVDCLPRVQLVLVLAWAILGPGWVTVRGVAALLLGTHWLLGWAGVVNTQGQDITDELAVALAMAAVAILTLVRLLGLRVARSPFPHVDRGSQYSIRALFLSTTLVAGAVAMLEYLRPSIGASQTLLGLEPWLSPRMVREIVLSAVLAAVACGTIVTVLRPGTVWLRTLILAVVLPSLAGYLIHLTGTSDETLLPRIAELTLAFAALAVMTGVSVLPLRLFGYRLCRPATDPARSTVWQRIGRLFVAASKTSAAPTTAPIPETTT